MPARKAPFGARCASPQAVSALAKQDRIPIVERVKAGLERARLHGTRSGRPIGGQRIPAKKEPEVAAALLKEDRRMQKIARELSVGVSVVQRVKASSSGKSR
jgi:DNA invertase Pin-like site-specific DNA recombinase